MGEAARGAATPSRVGPRSLHVRARGVRLHALEWGATHAPPVVLVHGMRGHARWFTPVGPALSGERRALALDLRGHGESEHRPPYGHETYASDLVAWIDALGLERPILLGHSMGGSVCVRAGERLGARLRALVLVDTNLGGGPPPLLRRVLWRARRLLRGDRRGPGEPRIFESRDEVRRRFALRPGRTVASDELLDHLAHHAATERADGTFTWRFDPRIATARRRGGRPPDPRRITCPVALIYGAESPIARRADPERTAERFARAASLSVDVIDGAHHHVFLDRPEAFNAVLRRRLEALPE